MIEVEYIDHMGDDLTVVNAARVSFGKKSKYECVDLIKGRWEVKAADEKLIWYLAEHDHKSPFNHAFATFHVKAPIFVARQLQKHEYMPWNEISRRYVDSEPEFYEPEHWRGRSADKKQGSEGVVPLEYIDSFTFKHIGDYWDETVASLAYDAPYEEGRYTPEQSILDDIHYVYEEEVIPLYNKLLKAGVAPEQARMVLPQSMYTEWYWSGSLYAFAKMCSLRLKEDTQLETQVIAKQISLEMETLFPVSWRALL